MSKTTIRSSLKELLKYNIVSRKKGTLSDPRFYTYSINFENNWGI